MFTGSINNWEEETRGIHKTTFCKLIPGLYVKLISVMLSGSIALMHPRAVYDGVP